jgi:hypothetical protein
MIEQIRSALGNYVASNVFAILLIVVAARWPRIGRFVVSVGFLGAGIWNMFASLTMPGFYVSTYGPLASPPYAAFIDGPFAANPALFVVPIAIGHLATATGGWVKLALAGSMLFVAAIAPMGVGSAFPFSVFALLAFYLLYRRAFTSSMFEDLGATFAAVTHTGQPRGHARPR